MRRTRIFNVRHVCFFALSLTAGIIIAEAMSALPSLFVLCPMGVCAAVAAVVTAFKKSRKFFYIPVAVIIGLISLTAFYHIISASSSPDYSGKLQAEVASEIVIENDDATFYIDNIVIGGARYSGRAKVRAHLGEAPSFRAGDIIEIDGKLINYNRGPFDGYYASKAAKGEYYTVYASGVRKIADGEPSFILKVQLKIKSMLFENTDAHTAAICQALFLGDKSILDDGLYDNIKASGLAHVLAVSGLHVSALTAALYFVLKKLKVNKKAAFVFVGALSFLYVALCSFSPSALRAFIMCSVFAFADAASFKKDNLSALSLAASLIMIFRPVALMEAGFLLSVFSVLGIFLFAKPIKEAILKPFGIAAEENTFIMRYSATAIIPAGATGGAYSSGCPSGGKAEDALGANAYGKKEQYGRYGGVFDSAAADNNRAKDGRISLKDKIGRGRIAVKILSGAAEGGAVALAANIATYPLTAYFFQSIPVLFLLSSVVVLPYIIAVYGVLAVLVLFSLITTLGGALKIMDFLIFPFKAYTSAIGNLSFAALPVSASVVGIVTYAACMLIASRFVFLQKRTKIALVASLAACGAVGSLLITLL